VALKERLQICTTFRCQVSLHNSLCIFLQNIWALARRHALQFRTVPSVCLSDDNFRKLWSMKFIRFSSRQYGQSSYIKVICRLKYDNFRKPRRSTFIFAHRACHQEIRVKFVYKGHRIEVTVTGAKNVKNSYSRNVKLLSAITPVL